MYFREGLMGGSFQIQKEGNDKASLSQTGSSPVKGQQMGVDLPPSQISKVTMSINKG